MYYIEDLMTNFFYLFPTNFYCVDTTVEYRKVVKFASVLAEGELSEYFVMQIKNNSEIRKTEKNFLGLFANIWAKLLSM